MCRYIWETVEKGSRQQVGTPVPAAAAVIYHLIRSALDEKIYISGDQISNIISLRCNYHISLEPNLLRKYIHDKKYISCDQIHDVLNTSNILNI